MLLALLAAMAVMEGCSEAERPIFEQRHPPLTWPSAPARPRIRYVGQLRSSADLKPQPKPFEALGELLAGKKEPDRMYGPRAVVCTPDGERVWVADPGGRCLHLFDLLNRSYRKITRAGGSRLLSPVGMCLGPDESLYVCDSESVDVHRLHARTGFALETLRLPEDVLRPVAVSFDGRAQELFVVDVLGHDIKVLGPDGRLIRIIGRRGGGRGQFNFPSDIVDDRDILWVCDTGNQRVQGLTRAGEAQVILGQAGDAPGDLAMPKGLATDSDGHLYVVDARFENIQVFDRDGRLLLYVGQEGTGPGEFWLPAGIFVDAGDRIWVCDTYNKRLQVFDYLKEERAADDGDAGGRMEPAAGQDDPGETGDERAEEMNGSGS